MKNAELISGAVVVYLLHSRGFTEDHVSYPAVVLKKCFAVIPHKKSAIENALVFLYFVDMIEKIALVYIQ